MKNTTSKKKQHVRLSEKSSWAYWMQAIEPTSEELKKAFPDYHPQWVIQSQLLTDITGEHFQYLRKNVLRITPQQCAAYLRVTQRTIRLWEKGDVRVPFMAFELLRMVYRSAQFRLSHPDWDGWFISTTGKLISPDLRDHAMSPSDLNLVPYLHNWNATMKAEIVDLTQKLNDAQQENTKLRQMFVAQGVVDELAAMQDTIAELMTRIATAKIIPFQAAPIEQPKEKIA